MLRKSSRAKKAKQGDKDLPKLPNLSLELKQDEISEDLFRMTGKTPSKKIKKKAKKVQKPIDVVFPGGSLETLTVDRYKVSGSSRKAK